jgi:hypothetical protein
MSGESRLYSVHRVTAAQMRRALEVLEAADQSEAFLRGAIGDNTQHLTQLQSFIGSLQNALFDAEADLLERWADSVVVAEQSRRIIRRKIA